MKASRLTTLSLVVALVGGAMALRPASVQAVDIEGPWTLTVVAPNPGCQFTGPMEITPQGGSDFSGTATTAIVSGSSPQCPQSFVATGMGTLSGNDIVFGLVDLSIGTANFTGTVAADELSATGTWTSAELGEGSWFALRLAAQAPTLCGNWTLDVDVTEPDCALRGPMTLTQQGSALRGKTTLSRVSGASPCPLTAAPNVVGSVSGSTVRLGLVLPTDGFALFEGTLSGDGASMSGTWLFEEETTGGTFTAACSGVAAPAVGGGAIGLLGVLLLLGGRRVVRRFA